MKILTFDIEEWFHVLDNPETGSIENWKKFHSRLREGVDTILQILDDTNQSATFFCLGWVAEKHPAVIESIVTSGHQIATHSYAHQLAYTQTPGEFREDLRRSIGILEDISSKPITCYRAPGFSIIAENLWAFEALIEEGIKIDSSLFPANRAHGGLPHFISAEPTLGSWAGQSIRLFPINTKTILNRRFIYSGGGYFRLFPAYLVKRWFANDGYVMTYFHPRDFDPDQPMIPGLSTTRKIKSYIGIKGAQKKLKIILNSHQFVNLEQASAAINWERAPTYDISGDYLSLRHTDNQD